MGLKNKIVAMFLLCSLVPLAASSLISFFSVRETLRQEIFSELKHSANDTMRALEARMERSLRDLDTWGRLRTMQDVLIGDDGKEISSTIAELRTRYPEFAELVVTNSDGKIVATTKASLLDAEKPALEAFKTAMKGRVHAGHFKTSSLTGQQTMTFAVPIVADYDDKVVIGTLIGVLNWGHVSKTLAMAPVAAGSQGAARLLAITDAQTGEWLYRNTPSDWNSGRSVEVNTNDDASSNSNAERTMMLDGTQFIVTTALSQTSGLYNDPDLALHAAISTPVAFASISQLTRNLLIAALVTFCIIIILGIVGANSITGPITSMIAAMKRLAAGETDISFPALGRKDELGEMSAALQVFHSTKLDHVSTQEREQEILAREQERITKAEIDAGIQTDIDATVRAAVAGDFSHRIDTSTADGVMLSLAEGMNTLLDVVDRGLGDTVSAVTAMSRGDLTREIEGDYQGSFAGLRDGTNRMGTQMRDIAGRIVEVTGAVQHTTSEIAAGVTDLSERTEHQASSLEETTASMEELSATVRQNADNAQEANQVAVAARLSAANGGEVVDEVVKAMSRIEGSSKKITDIVGLIQEIAFQTNLLALNAAVEAARAGDAGKGFAVVANEVRALAQRSAQASKDIKELIATSDNEVRDGVELVNRAGESLGEILGSVKKVADFVSEIAAASQEQSSGIDQVSRAINSMEEMTQQNGALVEETTAALQSAQSQVGDLREVVAFFKTGEEAMEMAKAEPETEEMPIDHPVHLQQTTVRRAVAGGAAAAVAGVVDDDDDWQEF